MAPALLTPSRQHMVQIIPMATVNVRFSEQGSSMTLGYSVILEESRARGQV